MASLSKRNGKWQARVRRIGHATRAQSFASKADAQRWIRAIEAELDRTLIPGDTQRLDDLTVADILRRYQATVTVKKRGSLYEAKRIDVFLTQPWASLLLSKATAQVFAGHRDRRLAQVSPGTVIRELGLIRSIFETAMREWDIPFPENPLARLKKPRAPEGRDRRLNEGELQALLAPSAIGRSDWLRTCILLAIETGMRRSELLNIRWQDIDFTQSVLTIPVTKNGCARRIPLTTKATEILLNERPNGHDATGRMLPVTANALRLAWERCRRRAARDYPGITELHFHDLRHEAVSRFFELGLSAAEVALISGHRDMRMLFRYTHLKPERLAEKLRYQKYAIQNERQEAV